MKKKNHTDSYTWMWANEHLLLNPNQRSHITENTQFSVQHSTENTNFYKIGSHKHLFNSILLSLASNIVLMNFSGQHVTIVHFYVIWAHLLTEWLYIV